MNLTIVYSFEDTKIQKYLKHTDYYKKAAISCGFFIEM